MKRRLAAILAADVVGYSRMMGADEAATLAAFAVLRHEVFEPSVARHGGTVVKRTGDGWLVEFASALDAVDCAWTVQRAITGDGDMRLRIGVHLGDVMHDEEGDIHGDGVNIAVRLEGVAPAGGIAISDLVHETLDSARRAEFADGGCPELKNIARRLRVWTWPEVDLAAKPEVVAPGERPLILLEPLSLGGDTEAAGEIALDVISGLEDALAHRSGIRVAMKGEAAVAASYIFHGRCRVVGARCRLHLFITDTGRGEVCWSTKIDGDMGDVFGFVDDVVRDVSTAMRVHMNARAGAVFADVPDETLTGQQLLSKAAYLMHLFDPRSMARAQETMKVAVEREPENAMALAMYSYTLMHTVPLAMDRVTDIDVDRVLEIADRAVAMGQTVDYAFHNRARIRLWLRGDHAGCVQDARRAMTINPDFHFAAEDLALVDIFGDRPQAGVEVMNGLVERFPTHPTFLFRLSILAIGHALLGDAARALELGREAYERKPLIRLHAIAFAAGASGRDEVTGGPEFRSMIEAHGLRVSDAGRFPFADDAGREKLELLLRGAGLPA